MMLLIIAVGMFLVIYGSLHNGLPEPRLLRVAPYARVLVHG